MAQRAILGRALRALVPSPTGHTPRSTGGAPATGAANPAAEGGSGKATAGLCRGAGQEPVAEVGAGSGGRAGRATGRFDGALADDTAAARGASGARVSVCFDKVRARSEVRGTGARALWRGQAQPGAGGRRRGGFVAHPRCRGSGAARLVGAVEEDGDE